MGGVKKTSKKIFGKDTLKERLDPFSGGSFTSPLPHKSIKNTFEEGVEDATMLFTPDIPVPEEQTVIPIPDESMQANEQRRRRARQSRTGRSSTMLTEGLGE